jgi:hypothetical protein
MQMKTLRSLFFLSLFLGLILGCNRTSDQTSEKLLTDSNEEDLDSDSDGLSPVLNRQIDRNDCMRILLNDFRENVSYHQTSGFINLLSVTGNKAGVMKNAFVMLGIESFSDEDQKKKYCPSLGVFTTDGKKLLTKATPACQTEESHDVGTAVWFTFDLANDSEIIVYHEPNVMDLHALVNNELVSVWRTTSSETIHKNGKEIYCYGSVGFLTNRAEGVQDMEYVYTCGDGNVTKTMYRWNGRRYVAAAK